MSAENAGKIKSGGGISHLGRAQTYHGDTETLRKTKRGLPLINAINADQEPLPQRTRRGSQQSALSQRDSIVIDKTNCRRFTQMISGEPCSAFLRASVSPWWGFSANRPSFKGRKSLR